MQAWRHAFRQKSSGIHDAETSEAFQARYADLVLDLPANARTAPPRQTGGSGSVGRGRPELDPIAKINALIFPQYVKATKDFSAAANACHDYDHGDDPDNRRDDSGDPKRTSLDHAAEMLDVVDMLLWRRQFHADRICDLIRAISVFTDSSPVTGEELQGMIIEFIKKIGVFRD